MNYHVVAILYDCLPASVLSRGTLTAVRGAFTSKSGLAELSKKFTHTSCLKNLQPREHLFAITGALATHSNAISSRDFLQDILQPVFDAIGVHAKSLPSVRNPDPIYNDRTSQILAAMRSKEEKSESTSSSLKRRYSPGKENFASGSLLGAPTSPTREIKRRRSIHDGETGSSERLGDGEAADAEGKPEPTPALRPRVALCPEPLTGDPERDETDEKDPSSRESLAPHDVEAVALVHVLEEDGEQVAEVGLSESEETEDAGANHKPARSSKEKPERPSP
ncbi:hypothetical protein DFH06DRAFT_694540 [Mycena polygramma]|nr:hypothetical protein DFH06DRAFT_694540 [Mycena polygramma]